MLPVFRVFSVISFVCSLLYALYHYTIGRRLAANNTKDEVFTETCALCNLVHVNCNCVCFRMLSLLTMR